MQDVKSEIYELRCEFMKTPLGIDDINPALSWKIKDDRRGAKQIAYHILVASTEQNLVQNVGDLWDSGEQKSDKSHLVRYNGKPLKSRQRCFWKVLVKTVAAEDSKEEITWSEPSWWEMGLLKPDDWKGCWIQSSVCRPVDNETTKLWSRMSLIPQELNNGIIKSNPELIEPAKKQGKRFLSSILPPPLFRSKFKLQEKVKRARLYIAGLGFQEAFINGRAVSNNMHDPGVNFFEKRAGYVTHDVTDLLVKGNNVLTAIVGTGWWNESIVWGSPEKVKGLPSLRAQLEMELENGKKVVLATDGSWTTAIGPMQKSHYYAGEVYDARLSEGCLKGTDESTNWVSATEIKDPVPKLEAQRCEPERIIRRVKPVSVKQPRPGIWVFDMGELIMGTVELNVKAPVGTKIVMRSSEWIWNPSKQGPNFVTSLLHYDDMDCSSHHEGMIVGKPRGGTYYSWSFKLKETNKLKKVHLGVPTFVYVTKGDENGERWHPSFTIHPFRYIEVQGLSEEPSLDLLTGLVITNDEEVVGEFSSSNKLFNDIWEASMNSTRYTTHGMTWDNAVERCQSQVYNAWSAPFASYVLWYPNLWRKVMEDQRLANVLEKNNLRFANAIYGNRGKAPVPIYVVTQSVTVELPMQYYDRYGDIRELEKHYRHMKTWVEALFPDGSGKIIPKATMGAWCDHFFDEMSADGKWIPDWDRKAMMSMMMYEYVNETAEVAALLGRKEEEVALHNLSANIRSVVNTTWYNSKNKTYGAAADRRNKSKVDASTGWHGLMAMAIAKGIAPEADVPQLLENCIKDMKLHYNSHAAAGHITHQLLYDVYTDHGLVETCYDMMNATGYPSYAWMLQSGNKTIPEGPSLPDQLPAKSSAYQNECQEPARWFTQSICGVSPDRKEPGFKHVLLCPHFPSRLSSASLVTTTPYGQLESKWSQKNGTVIWIVRIPANSYATATIPCGKETEILESGKLLSEIIACKVLCVKNNITKVQLGAGNYVFKFPAPHNIPSKLNELK